MNWWIYLKYNWFALLVIAFCVSTTSYLIIDLWLDQQKANEICKVSGFEKSYTIVQIRSKKYAVCGSYPTLNSAELTTGVLKEIK